jgi:hypothetical protein
MALFDSAGRGYNLSMSEITQSGASLRSRGQRFFSVLGASLLVLFSPKRFVEEAMKSSWLWTFWERRYGAGRSLVSKTIVSMARTYDRRRHATNFTQIWAAWLLGSIEHTEATKNEDRKVSFLSHVSDRCDRRTGADRDGGIGTGCPSNIRTTMRI